MLHVTGGCVLCYRGCRRGWMDYCLCYGGLAPCVTEVGAWCYKGVVLCVTGVVEGDG